MDIDQITERALSLSRAIAGCEFIPGRDMTPVNEVMESQFKSNSITWVEVAIIAQTVRILQRKEQGEELTRQLVEWLVHNEI